MLSLCLLTLNVSDEKSTVNHSGVPVSNLSFFLLLLSRISLSLWLSKFGYDVTMYGFFILMTPGICWASQTCRLMLFIIFGKFLVIVPSNIFFLLFLSFLSSFSPITYVGMLDGFSQISEALLLSSLCFSLLQIG